MNYEEFKSAVINAAEANNIKEYELFYSSSDGMSVSVYKDEVKNYSADNSLGVCFRCIYNDKLGYASTENLSEEEAVSVVARALENAASIESEEQVFIHIAGDIYQTYEGENMEEPTGAELIDCAMELQKNIYAQDKRVKDGTETETGFKKSQVALYNSNGLDLSDSYQFGYAYGFAIVGEGEEMYDGFDVVAGDVKKFDLDKAAKGAVEDAVSTIGSTSVDSGKYNIVFSGQVMSTFLATFGVIFSAENVQKGLSLLKDKEGEVIASPILTLTDDPMYKEALVKRSFDDEGVATYKKNVIENGKLITLLHNLKTAAVAGTKTTGNAAKGSYAGNVGISSYSFFINPVKGTKEELMAKAQNGIYLTSIEGLHAGANPTTGDFSLSSTGFMIENGKKTTPVKNFTISGNFYDLLKNITEIGEDLEFRKAVFGMSRTGSPSILVPGITVAGK